MSGNLCMMKLLFLLTVLGAATAWKNYDGYQLLEVTPEITSQVEFLRKLMISRHELDFWLEPVQVGRPAQVMVGPESVEQLKITLDLQDLDITVIEENLRDVVGDEPRTKKDDPSHRAYDYNNYNEYEDFITEIDNLNVNCNERTDGVSCDVEVIGGSSEGRDLKILKIDTGAEHNFWIDSCIHAREWLACATVMNIVNKMLSDDSAEADTLLKSHNWYILPVFNPDGYTYTFTDNRLWRKSRSVNAGSTCIGTDLNRNHDFMWASGGGSSNNPCSDLYHGSAPASEPEVSIVQDYTREIPNLRGWLSFHTYGQYWLVPYGDCTEDPVFGQDTEAVATITCNAIQETYGTNWYCGNSCEGLYATSGTTADWAMGEIRVKYSYTPELRGGRFDPPPSAIAPSVNEIWNGMVAKINAIKDIEG